MDGWVEREKERRKTQTQNYSFRPFTIKKLSNTCTK